MPRHYHVLVFSPTLPEPALTLGPYLYLEVALAVQADWDQSLRQQLPVSRLAWLVVRPCAKPDCLEDE